PLQMAAAALLVLAAGCGAPVQRDALVIAPGAGARLAIAMRYGYGALKDVPRPAEVRRAVTPEQLLEGPGATGRLGDWVLENGGVIAVIARPDGTARGGKLVD